MFVFGFFFLLTIVLVSNRAGPRRYLAGIFEDALGCVEEIWLDYIELVGLTY